MRKYFIVILYFFCIGNVTNSYGGEVKANYYLNINSKGALFAIYLNGIKVDDRMSESHQSISIPLNIAMKTEDNELEVVFSPVIGRDGGKYDFLIGPKESFYMNLSLERVSFKNRDRETVTLLNVSYDMEEEKIVTLEFEGGITVSGEIITGKRNLQGKIILISFKNCTVSHNNVILFKPEWGTYDMAVGKNIVSAFSGPADLNSFDLITHVPSEKTIHVKKSNELLKLEALYQQVRDYRDGKNKTIDIHVLNFLSFYIQIN